MNVNTMLIRVYDFSTLFENEIPTCVASFAKQSDIMTVFIKIRNKRPYGKMV